ncbi:MAG: hypothetical protein Fues2KO_31050 [Fuerstiella sp.]
MFGGAASDKVHGESNFDSAAGHDQEDARPGSAPQTHPQTVSGSDEQPEDAAPHPQVPPTSLTGQAKIADDDASSSGSGSDSEDAFWPDDERSEEVAAAERDAINDLLVQTASRHAWEAFQRQQRRRRRLSLILFVCTFLSTTLVGADYWPLDLLPGFFDDQVRDELLQHLDRVWPTAEQMSLADRFWQTVRLGCTYSIPLMIILSCHEMGHYLQAVRYRVPATLPYFIPLPLPPLGTMGAVILQGRGSADRRQMFDIAVTGPIAGLIVTMPILIYGIMTSEYAPLDGLVGFEFGTPLLIDWMVAAIHGPTPDGQIFVFNGYATAGWVGVFITAMNLLPIGQLDGGHILYTMIGKAAHWVAWGLILTAVAVMLYTHLYSYVLLLILLTLTGPRHPPTADDTVPLGRGRILTGTLTLCFLLIGFTFQPIIVPEENVEPLQQLNEEQAEQLLVLNN